MENWRLALAGVWAACLSTAAVAQPVELAPSDAVACLSMPDEQRGGPEYPFAALKLDRVGRVKVQAEFSAPDRQPTLKVLESDGEDSFVEAVRAHVHTWRVPCLGSGPARLIREFVFKPDGRKVHYGDTSDADDAARKAKLDCLVRPKGQASPYYPRKALRDEVQGRVLARIRYTQPDQPPTVQLFARPNAAPLLAEVESWLNQLRLPCLGAEPISTQMLFVFRLGDDAWGLKPLILTNLLSRMKGLGERQVDIDTTRMGCPFDLSFYYRQPAMRNGVGSIGSHDPARQPLLELLRDLALDLPGPTLDIVFGDTTTVTVPCIKIDLKPKEKS